MTKFRYASDLHLEFAFDKRGGFLEYTSSEHEMFTKFRDYADHIIPPVLEDADTVLILAGDICEGARAHTRYSGFFSRLSDRFNLVIWVAGNHEYYGGKLSQHHNDRIRANVQTKWPNVRFCAEDKVYVREDLAVLGCTLWTDVNRGNPLSTLAAMNMNDYKLITHAEVDRDIYRALRVSDTMREHERQLRWIKEELIALAKVPFMKVIVVTHHAPSYQSIEDRYIQSNDPHNPAYASECLAPILLKPEVWIHGHLHNSSNYTVDYTRVMANPYGYMTDHVNKQYDLFANFEL